MNPALFKKDEHKITQKIQAKVVNTSKNIILADKAIVADTFLKRLIGLLNRSFLNKGEALILSPSDSIHSFFMRFTIDVLFLDKNNKVIKSVVSLRPWRLTGVYFKSRLVIELPAGTIKSTNTQEEDTISIL